MKYVMAIGLSEDRFGSRVSTTAQDTRQDKTASLAPHSHSDKPHTTALQKGEGGIGGGLEGGSDTSLATEKEDSSDRPSTGADTHNTQQAPLERGEGGSETPKGARVAGP